MKAQIFKTENGDYHLIDESGNHFINGKCVNPLKGEGKIGDTYPPEKDRIYNFEKVQLTSSK